MIVGFLLVCLVGFGDAQVLCGKLNTGVYCGDRPTTQHDESQLFPFGPKMNDAYLGAVDDGPSAQVSLTRPFYFFNQSRTTLFVNPNGLLSFGNAVASYTPTAFPIAAQPVICVFWGDVDLRGPFFDSSSMNNRAYYQEYTPSSASGPAMISLVRTVVQTRAGADAAYRAFLTFSPNWAFVATWWGVDKYSFTNTPTWATTNSFQIVLSCDAQNTCITLFNYPSNGLHWTYGSASSSTPAQVGFDAGDQRNYYAVAESRTSAITNLAGQGYNSALFFLVSGSTITQGGRISPVIYSITPPFLTGGQEVTIRGYAFGDNSAFNTIAITIGNQSCPLSGNIQNDTYLKCILPVGAGDAKVVMMVGNRAQLQLPDWETNMYLWTYASQVTSADTCVALSNPYSNTSEWNDNFFCSPLVPPLGNLKALWRYSPLAGYKCTLISAPDNNAAKWTPAYYCLPQVVGDVYNLTFSWNGKLAGKSCVLFTDTQEPSWNPWNQYLCSEYKQPYGPLMYLTYPYPRGTLTSISPSTGGTVGNYLMTVTGTNYGQDPSIVSVAIGGSNCTIQTSGFSPTSFQCLVPPGEYINSVVLTVGGYRATNSPTFTYLGPAIQSSSPSLLASQPASTAEYLTLAGQNFGAVTGQVKIGPSTFCAPITVWNNTQIICAQSGVGVNLPVTVYDSHGVAGGGVNVSFILQQISAVSPSSSLSDGQVTINITGTNFGPGAGSTVSVGGFQCPLLGLGWSNSLIQCQVPSGVGANRPVVVTVANRNSNTVPFTYLPPTVSSVTPPYGANGIDITISGSSFGAGSSGGTVTVGTVTATCPTSSWSHSQITCRLPTGSGANQAVVVTSGSVASNSNVAFSYSPIINSLSPSTGITDGGYTVYVLGSGFSSPFVVNWNGGNIATAYDNSTSIHFTMPAGVGTNNLLLQNGPIQSNAITFTYLPPVISLINPTQGSTSGGDKVIISGANFGVTGNISVTFNFAPANITSRTQTSLQVQSPPGVGLGRSVVVIVAGQTSNSNKLFDYLTPILANATPAHFSTKGLTTVTLMGDGFGSLGGTVNVGPTPVTVTTSTNNMVTFQLPPATAPGNVSLSFTPNNNAQSTTIPFLYDLPTITNFTGPTPIDTQSGQLITINGDSFGTAASVTVDGAVCSPNGASIHTQVQCLLPAGQGTNRPLVVTAGSFSASTLISRARPLLTSLSISNGPTAGGVPLTLFGSYFGLSGSVSIGNVDCPVTSWAHTQITCTLPPSSGGTNQAIVVTTANPGSQSSSGGPVFNFDRPVITSIAPMTGQTIGGQVVVIRGSNFGTNAVVTIQGFGTCVPTAFAQTHLQYECVVPAGTGTNIAVSLTTALQTNVASNSAQFSYLPPTISSVSPVSGITNGGFNLTLAGANFGAQNQNAVIRTLGTTINTYTVNASQQQVIFSMPAGTGINVPITFTVGGQSATISSFSFAPPRVDRVQGCPVNTATSATECPVLGTTPIIITGANFGSNASLVSVTVDGNITCPLISTVSHTSLQCNLPARPTGGYSLNVVVTVNTQSSSPQPFVSYGGPTIQTGTLRLAPASLPGGNVTAANTNTSFDVTLEGQNWGINGQNTGLSIAIMSPGTSYTKPCALSTTLVVNAGHSIISCTVPAGTVGKDLSFVVTAGQLTSLPSVDRLSFPAPVILPNTIRVPPASAAVTVTGQKFVGDLVRFTATNLGSDISVVSVAYGQGTALNKQCSFLSFQGSELECTTQDGTGSGYTFVVTVLNQASNRGTDVFNYLTMPVITSVSGCTNTGNSTINCPTAGGVTIIITGTDLGSSGSSSVRIGGALCTNLQGAANQLNCTLPAGTGNPAKLVIQDGLRASPIVTLLSYKSATVTQLVSTGCTQSGNNVVNCPRDNTAGTLRITLTGQNFGALPPSIIIGGDVCSNPIGGADPHSQVSCVLPSGTNLGRNVIFIQNGGDITITPLTVSFVQCIPGTFATQSTLLCSACPVATYSAVTGAFSCLACPSGTFANQTQTTACSTCARGSFSKIDPFALVGTTNCSTCLPGTYAAYTGQESCDSCLPGSYAGLAGASDCVLCEQGRFTGDIGSAACTNCSTGSFASSTGYASCDDCPPGTAVNITGQSACSPCSAGTIAALGGSSLCTPCGLGQFISSPGQAACQECDPGFYNDVAGAANCKACGAGSYSVKAAGKGPLVCSVCPQGSYNPQNGQAQCLPCLPGTYNNQTNQTQCSKCDPGRSADQPSQVGCRDCVPGTFASQSGSVQCLQCQQGSASNSSASQACVACLPGQYQDQVGQLNCQLCQVGTAMPSIGQALCLACDSGTFADGPGFVQCAKCDPGRFSSKAGVVGPITCVDCPVGTFGAVSGLARCLDCPVGNYQNVTKQLSCVPCPVGSSVETTGNVACTQCQVGTFATNIGAIICDQCAVGQYSNSTGSTLCSDCLAGSYQPGSGRSFCLDCQAGSYSGFQGQQACVLCVPGTYTSGSGASICAGCAPGSYADTSGLQLCKPCDAGKYQPSVAQAYCLGCNVGEYQNQTGQAGCIKCDVGRVADQVNSLSCRACTAGSYAAVVGSITCALCDPGTFLNTDGGSSCAPCDRGSTQSQAGQISCDLCLPGQYMSATGQYVCSKCDAGTFSGITGATWCEPCARGSFSVTSEGALGATTCKLCNAGTHQQAQGQSLCIACELGSSGNTSGMYTCDPCPAGFYTDLSSQTSCKACQPGRITSVEGQFYCNDCDLGYSTNSSGQSVCSQCLPGKIAATPGSLSCADCLVGSYQSAPAQKACVACDPGTFANMTGMDACDSCPAGFYTDQAAQSTCQACVPGRITSAEGQNYCDTCDLGYYTNFSGQSACARCSPGKIASLPGSLFCTDCLVGTYQNAPGQKACVACDSGTYANLTGSSACSACAPGTSQLFPSSTDCPPCLAGSSQPSLGQTKCLACLPGFYGNYTGASNCTKCEAGRAQDQASSVSCNICQKGSFAAAGATACRPCAASQVAPLDGTETCSSCPANSVADSVRVLCICEVGFALVTTDTTNLYCEKCPKGAVCSERGLVYDALVTEAGWYVRDSEFEQCLLRTHCPGGGTGGDAQCAPNRVGVLCAVCADGFTQDFSGNCVPCGTHSSSVGFLVLIVFIFVFVLIAMYGFVLNSNRQLIAASKIESQIAAGQSQGYIADEHYEILDYNYRHGKIVTIEGPPAPKPNATFKLKIALGFLQICTNLMFSMDIPWPWGFKRFLLVFNFANLDFFASASVDCVVDRDFYYYIKLWGSVLIPILGVAALYLFFVVPNYMLHRLKTREDFAHRKATRQRFWCLVFFTLFLVYPYVCAVILRLYQCISPFGETRLRHDMTLKCDPNSAWGEHTKLAAPMAIIYPLGIPFLMFMMLRRYQKHGRLNELGVRAELGFLYDAYERKFWWWEMCDMLHKLCVVSMVAFLPNAYYQVPGALIIIYFYFAAILWCKPYLRKADDRVHQAAQSELVLFLLAAMYLLYQDDPSPTEEWWFTFILIFAFCVFFLFFLSGLIYSLKKLFEHSSHGQRFLEAFDAKIAETRGLKKFSKQHRAQQNKKKKQNKPQNFMEGILDLEYDVREKYKNSQSMRIGVEDDEASKIKMTRSPLRADNLNTGAVSYEAHTGQEIVAVVNPLSALVGNRVEIHEAEQNKLAAQSAQEFDVVTTTTAVQPTAEPARRIDDEPDDWEVKKVKAAM